MLAWIETMLPVKQQSERQLNKQCILDEMGNTAVKMNYYASLADLEKDELENCKVGLIGAGVGGGFNHTSKLHVMKYKETINEHDGELGISKLRKNTNQNQKQDVETS